MTRYRKTFREALEEVNTLKEAQYKYDGKVVFISKKEFAKVSKDYKNATPGQERMVVLDPKSQATVSAPVKFTEEKEKEPVQWPSQPIEESFSDAQIKQLQKEYEPLRGKKISVDNANKLGAMFTKFDKDKNALEKLYGGNIPFISTMAMTRLMTKHGYKAAQLNKIRKEEYEAELDLLEEHEFLTEAKATVIIPDKKRRDNLVHLCKQVGIKTTIEGDKVHMSGIARRVMDISLAMQRNGFKIEGKMSDIHAMDKEGKSAAEIAKALKVSVSAVKAILGEEVEENAPSTADMDRLKKMGMKPKKEEGEDKEKLKSEIDKKDQEIAMLKQKAETEKAKVAKKETEKMVNPETGEPLLQVGIAYKHLKDKMKKESTDAEKSKAYAIGMSVAKKKYNDEPPLEKKTIKKAHEIGDKILKKEEHPAKEMYEQIKGLKNKAEKSGMPYGILKKVYDRGMAAWRGGHRPGASQQQWAFARVNSFITKSSGTWGGADKDLAAKVRGSK